MRNTERLTFINNKSESDLINLWENCFYGQANYNFMHVHVPQSYRVPSQNALNQFLMHYKSTWLVKRIIENDIIGFAVHGDFIPGLPNNIGFNIGLKYTRRGYPKETLVEMIEYLRSIGLHDTFGHCMESNIASIRTMESCGFDNLGRTTSQFNDIYELKFRIHL
jgi:RimJ/RimL family protein N-acetyltransferase